MRIRIETISFTGVTSKLWPARLYEKMGLMPESQLRAYAPRIAAGMAGNPNFRAARKLICAQSRAALNKLLRRWTIAVRAMAVSIGKNKAKKGINNVPRPKPEKRVNAEIKKEESIIMAYCISGGRYGKFQQN